MGSVIMFIVILVAILGWGLNIHSLATSKTLSGMSVLRTIGIFLVPLGCILGFVNNKEETESK